MASDRVELGRAAKLTGNITTPTLVIEQGAVFEGSCKMTQAKAATDKTKVEPKVERKDNVIDVAKPAVKVESSNSKPAVAAVAS